MTDRLRALALAAADRSHAPYSGDPVGAVALLADGRWTSAPRLENASFPLTISALQGALNRAMLSGQRPVAVALSRPLAAAEVALLEAWTNSAWRLDTPDVALVEGAPLPALGDAVPVVMENPAPPDAASLAMEALAAAERAVVPASGFRVGAVVEDAEGRLVTGANVEHEPDWSRGLCAERTALVGAVAAGLGPIRRLAVACPTAPGGTPCGGCRQVIAELAPDAEVVIWRGDDPPDVTTPAALLPGAFRGSSLER